MLRDRYEDLATNRQSDMFNGSTVSTVVYKQSNHAHKVLAILILSHDDKSASSYAIQDRQSLGKNYLSRLLNLGGERGISTFIRTTHDCMFPAI